MGRPRKRVVKKMNLRSSVRSSVATQTTPKYLENGGKKDHSVVDFCVKRLRKDLKVNLPRISNSKMNDLLKNQEEGNENENNHPQNRDFNISNVLQKKKYKPGPKSSKYKRDKRREAILPQIIEDPNEDDLVIRDAEKENSNVNVTVPFLLSLRQHSTPINSQQTLFAANIELSMIKQTDYQNNQENQNNQGNQNNQRNQNNERNQNDQRNQNNERNQNNQRSQNNQRNQNNQNLENEIEKIFEKTRIEGNLLQEEVIENNLELVTPNFNQSEDSIRDTPIIVNLCSGRNCSPGGKRRCTTFSANTSFIGNDGVDDNPRVTTVNNVSIRAETVYIRNYYYK